MRIILEWSMIGKLYSRCVYYKLHSVYFYRILYGAISRDFDLELSHRFIEMENLSSWSVKYTSMIFVYVLSDSIYLRNYISSKFC